MEVDHQSQCSCQPDTATTYTAFTWRFPLCNSELSHTGVALLRKKHFMQWYEFAELLELTNRYDWARCRLCSWRWDCLHRYVGFDKKSIVFPVDVPWWAKKAVLVHRTRLEEAEWAPECGVSLGIPLFPKFAGRASRTSVRYGHITAGVQGGVNSRLRCGTWHYVHDRECLIRCAYRKLDELLNGFTLSKLKRVHDKESASFLRSLLVCVGRVSSRDRSYVFLKHLAILFAPSRSSLASLAIVDRCCESQSAPEIDSLVLAMKTVEVGQKRSRESDDYCLSGCMKRLKV